MATTRLAHNFKGHQMDSERDYCIRSPRLVSQSREMASIVRDSRNLLHLSFMGGQELFPPPPQTLLLSLTVRLQLSHSLIALVRCVRQTEEIRC